MLQSLMTPSYCAAPTTCLCFIHSVTAVRYTLIFIAAAITENNVVLFITTACSTSVTQAPSSQQKGHVHYEIIFVLSINQKVIFDSWASLMRLNLLTGFYLCFSNILQTDVSDVRH